MIDTLKTIHTNTIHQHVVLGSLVKTNVSNFYIALSIGKIELENDTYFVISKSSPIGELLYNKTTGDCITFNNTTYTITEIR